MGDETRSEFSRYLREQHGPPPDLDKARAERRANAAADRADGLICDTPIARNSDPDTSHQAAAFMHRTGTRATHQQRVLDVVRRLPGLTLLEISKQCDLDDHKVGKRLSDLANAGKIEKGNERYVDGLPYTTWWNR